MSRLKLFVAYHKQAHLIKNNYLVPIHVGRALNSNKWLEENMIGDNIGDNISEKNNRYCELTAQYYAWKNSEKFDNPDFIGLMHYRRFFNFSEHQYKENIYGQIEYPFFQDNFEALFGYNEADILKLAEQFDVITVKPTYIGGEGNVFTHYKKYHHIKDYKVTLKILLEKFPEFNKAVKEYNNSKYAYFTNSFIMSKDLFNKYSEWLFSILFEADKFIKNYKDTFDNRVMGFIAERLFGVYITYLKQKGLKIKELQQIIVQETDLKRYIPIVFSCNNNYTLPLCGAISTLKNNADNEDFFFVYIINTKKNLNYLNKKLISRMKGKNCIIQYKTIDNEIFKTLPIPACCSHISEEAYYRLLLPELFPMFSKIIYLDCDILVLSSLYDLFNQLISNNYFAGVEDVLAKESLQRLNISKYCNSGVLLVNLNKWRVDKVQNKFFDYININKDNLNWPDQDVLNVVLQSGIKYLDKTWNAQVGEYECCYASGFNDIGKTAKIIHFIGVMKPWNYGNKSPFKHEYHGTIKHLGFEYKLIKYYPQIITTFFDAFLKALKQTRQNIIWYDKRNAQLVFFKKYKLGIQI